MIKNVIGTPRSNSIINGNFDFWQRGTVETDQLYLADRFRAVYSTNRTMNQSQSTDVPVASVKSTYSLIAETLSANSTRMFVPVMSSASQSGYVVSASHAEGGGGYEPFRAFDQNDGTPYASTTSSAWLKIDLGAGNERVVTKYDHKGCTTNWVLLGSNNGSDWDTLDTASISVNNNKFSRTFANSTAYRYYMIDHSSHDGLWWYMYSFDLYEEYALGADETDYSFMRYCIEGYDLLTGKANLSFRVKANKTGTYSIGLLANGSDRSFVSEYTIDVADTWEYKSIPIDFTSAFDSGTWDFTTGRGLQMYFVLAAGSDHRTTSLDVWKNDGLFASTNQADEDVEMKFSQIMLNEGSAPQEFKRAGENISGEFSLCQRYYQKHRFNGTADGVGFIFFQSNTTGYGTLHLIQEMRVTPTASVTSATNWHIMTNGGGAQPISLFNPYNTNKERINFAITYNTITAGIAYLLTGGSGGENHIMADAEIY